MGKLGDTHEGSGHSGVSRETDRRAHDSKRNPANVACFGQFRLHMAERLLEKDGAALKIGSRALDILIALVGHAPDVVDKRELISRVWGNLIVDEGSLRFHIAALRKALESGDPGARFISNIPGRGYGFTATVTWTAVTASAPASTAATPSVLHLPVRPLRMVGRDEPLRELTSLLRDQRFVSIVGAGGIGKTSVALSIAHDLLAEFDGAVYFVDLAAIEDPQFVVSTLATQLGLPGAFGTSLPVVLSAIRERRMLLVLDSCEHLIEAVATLAESIFRDAQHVYILTTSREALRAQGERVHHLSPLECPPRDARALTATEAMGFPAVQLFVEQVTASGYPFELTDADAPIVTELCRRLDGIALALELAASRVGSYGLQGIASLLEGQFRLLWRGRRTALPRHQTLSATLDWSYNLLSETERLTLRRLAVFVGTFSLEAALDVVAEDLDPAQVTETIATLVDKSLVALERTSGSHYRLLDSTRAYAWQKLVGSGEHRAIARRHAEHTAYRLERLKTTVPAPASPESLDFFLEHLSNIRAALEWSFSEDGDGRIGSRLSAAAAPSFYQLALLPECITWTDRALTKLDESQHGTQLELQLRTCWGLAVMNTKGNTPSARAALVRALELAESHEDATRQLLLSHALYRFQMRSGDLRELPALTQRCESAAAHIDDPTARALVHGVMACTCSLLGNHEEVPKHARLALSLPAYSPKLNVALFGYTHRIGARNVLARSLWFLGYPDQAMAVAKECVEEAESFGDPATLIYALAWNVFVYLRAGDWSKTEQVIEHLINRTTKHGLSTYHPVAVGCQGTLSVLRGDARHGVELLQTALAALHVGGYDQHRAVFGGILCEGLVKVGRVDLAQATVREMLEWARSYSAISDLPELLRINAEVLMAAEGFSRNEVEESLTRSLSLAREQSALSSELRAASSLARTWLSQGQPEKARGLLAPIYRRFSEGFNTPDLASAATLLQKLEP
jgi:predicted ATPase/DNA-binding winged helix-turn-helix (wHTH) protein